MAGANHRVSTDGILLALAGTACLLAATTAAVADQPRLVTALAVVAGLPAVLAAAADVATDYGPSLTFQLVLGVAALAGALAAVPGRHYVTIATLGVAGLMGLGRIYEVKVRGKPR